MPVGFTAHHILSAHKGTSAHDLKQEQNALRHLHSSESDSDGWDWSARTGAVQHLV